MQRRPFLQACLGATLLLGGPAGSGSGIAALAAHNVQSAAEPVRADRWLAPERLNEGEVRRLIGESAAAVEGRALRVRDGAATVAVDGPARDMLFLILSGTVAVEDLGVQDRPHGRVRGLRASATPPRSEVGAKQTLWIDVATRLPQRFEFTYEVPGLGDLAYDLLFE